jgi:hypothetical protein
MFYLTGFGPFVKTIFERFSALQVLNGFKKHNFIKTLSFPEQNGPFHQEFLKSVLPLSSAIFFEADLQLTIFIRPKDKIFGIQQKKKGHNLVKSTPNIRYAEYSVKTNYLADTKYSVLVKSRIFGYSVRPVKGRSLRGT